MQLPRNTSVTVKRIPSQQPGGGLLARMKAEAAAAAAAASVNTAAVASPILPVGVAPVIPSAPLTVVADPTKAGGAQTMEDELAALQSIHEQAEDMRGSRLGNKTWTASGGSNSDRVTNYYVGAQQGGGGPGGGGPGRGGGFYGGRGGRGPAGMGAGPFPRTRR
ncbi:hypothetical protein PINS_up016561 [Pythium insidiosum]|nr:hypothetical protein PINS_up016561 [Pythium insidiosum]